MLTRPMNKLVDEIYAHINELSEKLDRGEIKLSEWHTQLMEYGDKIYSEAKAEKSEGYLDIAWNKAVDRHQRKMGIRC